MAHERAEVSGAFWRTGYCNTGIWGMRSCAGPSPLSFTWLSRHQEPINGSDMTAVGGGSSPFGECTAESTWDSCIAWWEVLGKESQNVPEVNCCVFCRASTHRFLNH